MQALGAPMAGQATVRRNLLHGMESLEKALAFPVGDEQAGPLLTEAATMLEKVVAEEARNALAQNLLGSCYYNQAQAALKAGDEPAATELMKKSGDALKRAYSFRDNADSETLKLEIEADYALLIKADREEAIAKYKQLAAGDTNRTAALRANWMLAGIYAGDWNTPAEKADPAVAKEHVIQVLAHWEDSPQADALKKYLRWDSKKGNQYRYVPKENSDLLTAMQ